MVLDVLWAGGGVRIGMLTVRHPEGLMSHDMMIYGYSFRRRVHYSLLTSWTLLEPQHPFTSPPAPPTQAGFWWYDVASANKSVVA